MATIGKSTLAILILCSTVGAEQTKIALLLQNHLAEPHRDLADHTLSITAKSLEQNQRLRLADKELVAAAMAQLHIATNTPLSSEQGRTLGEMLDVAVVGLIDLTHGAYRIEGRLVETLTDAVVGEASVQGREDEVFDLVDVLGARLSKYLIGGERGPGTFAVVAFDNRAREKYGFFVRGLADMLAGSLGQASGLNAVARSEVEQGLARLGLEPGSALSGDEASALGRWLGVDAVVMGEFAEIYRIGFHYIDVHSGEVLGAVGAEGEERDIPTLADELGSELARRLDARYRGFRKVAILYFENRAADEYAGFVQGIADMLMTSLDQAEKLKLIERVQVDKAVENFNLELSGAIDAETAVEVGAWLGADAVVLGSFTQFGDLYRIDARLIDAATGELLLAQNVRGPEGDVIAMIDQLGSKLIDRFGAVETEINGGTGTLKIRFSTAKSEMGERPIYFHLCKLYVDGNYLGLSPVVEKLGQEVLLFTRSLKAGTHQVQLVHGYVKAGEWDGEMPQQPRAFHLHVEPDETATIRYEFEVGWFEDKYVYQSSW